MSASAAITTPRTIARASHARRQGARVVYLIASHVHPPQIERLVRACRSGSAESRVLLHHDYNVSHLDPRRVTKYGNVELFPAENVMIWGTFCSCAMILRCMRWLLDHHDFDWVLHLSGQDYPIRPLADIEADLSQSPYDGYLLSSPVELLDWEVGPSRYLYQYYSVPKFRGVRTLCQWIRQHREKSLAAGHLPFANIAVDKDRMRLGIRPFHGLFRDGFRCYKGSSWWCLNRRSVKYMTEYAEQHPKFVRYYRRVKFAPNESFYPTILLNNPELKFVTNDDRRLIRWTHPESGHPDMLTSADLGAITSSGKDFARKIDSRQDPKILDLLDEQIGLCNPAALAGA